MKYIKKVSNLAVIGSVALGVSLVLGGCEEQGSEQAQASEAEQGQNMFVVLQENADGTYEVVEKHSTTGPNRAIIRSQDGTERFMNEEELKVLMAAEAKKMEEAPKEEVSSGGGLSLGEAILGATTGAILGSLIGNAIANKMMNSPRYQQVQTRAASSYSRNAAPSTSSSKASSSRRSGFFGSSNSGKDNSRSSFGG